MLLPLNDLVKKYNLKVSGIIHAGAHHLEEMPIYKSMGVKDVVAVEPCSPAFNFLEKNFSGEVILFNCALGEKNDRLIMNVEKDNGGQSNSLLTPDMHLVQHSNIAFTDQEEVDVRTLDSLEIDRSKYNVLVMDCQGYEGYILRGGMETLAGIDIVYTEVNRGSVYKGNTLVDEMDNLLSDFKRVETVWVGLWGDSFFVRKSLLND